MIIKDGPAQMIVASPHTGHGHQPGAWFLHNRSSDTEVWFDNHLMVHADAGSTSAYIPPGAVIVVSGAQSVWAICRPGTYADLAVIPAASFGMQNPPVTPAPALGFAGPG